MTDIAIKVENLSKKYNIGVRSSGSLRETLTHKWQSLLGKDKNSEQEFWALKDISFDVKQGEILGIIGKNGAGKSTLLKVLSRITEPTSGRFILNGRVSSLLEVGTGFHPELTGRENIYLNGTILGMTRKEVKQKFDDIVNFSGVEKFIDTPVKHYSSGMYVRLAFAVAAHLEPEILIIDEVLAVGDAEFQKKCLGKMQDVAREGRTVIFISHDMQAISRLVNNCILLSKGEVKLYGEKQVVIDEYLSLGKKDINALSYQYKNESLTTPFINEIKLVTTASNNFQYNSYPFKISLKIKLPYSINKTCITIVVKDDRGINCVEFSYFDDEKKCSEKGSYTLDFTIPKFRLFMGKYSLTCYFAEQKGGPLFQLIEDVCPFEVLMYEQSRGDWDWAKYMCCYLEDFNCDINEN